MAKKKKQLGTQPILLNVDKETEAILRYLCEQSGKIYNTGVYFCRQTFFKTDRIITNKYTLDYEPTVCKTQLAKSIPSTPMQQTLRSVVEAMKGFKKLRDKWYRGELHFKPKCPGYLTGSKLFKVAYPNSGGQRPKIIDGQLRFSLGLAVKRWFGVGEFYLPMPSNLDYSAVKEFTILPKNGSYYLECSYALPQYQHDLDPKQALGMDLGTSASLAACVDTKGKSFLIDAYQLKAMNQLWNKKVSTRKEGKPEAYWDDWLDRVTRKRNHQMRDGINKAAKYIVNHAISHGIGTIVCGWNEDFKLSPNMGKKNNQKFVQIPLAKLRDRVNQLCDQHGINFVVTEEAYTSKASFLDGDTLHKFGEKPDGWKPSGRRVKRGLYKTAQGWLINCDLNGASNIISKVASNPDLKIDLGEIVRRSLATVARVRLWIAPKYFTPLAKESPSL